MSRLWMSLDTLCVPTWGDGVRVWMHCVSLSGVPFLSLSNPLVCKGLRRWYG